MKQQNVALPLLFPKDSKSLKILEIGLQEVGPKRGLSEHTDTRTEGHTDRQTDKSTYRKHRPRGLMLWKDLIKNTNKHINEVYIRLELLYIVKLH